MEGSTQQAAVKKIKGESLYTPSDMLYLTAATPVISFII